MTGPVDPTTSGGAASPFGELPLTDFDRACMARAIELSRSAMDAGSGGPFGAVIAMNGEIVGEGWNRVTSTNDPTAHAEVVAIRNACEKLGRFDLVGAVIYTSCEPCPMCLAATYWARISRMIYGNDRDDAASIGFDDAMIYHQVALPIAERRLPMQRTMADEARAVFDDWAIKEDRIPY